MERNEAGVCQEKICFSGGPATDGSKGRCEWLWIRMRAEKGFRS